jgi:hypothetical protein
MASDFREVRTYADFYASVLAPVGWNIDEPSLYFPCPFPPTYHAVTGSRTAGSHQAECRREQNSIGTGAASVMIVGADFRRL